MATESERGTRKPNVILLMTDQQRADALGCMGNRLVQTPNLDRLMTSGVIFEQAYVQCPVCMASRGAIHTGRYPRSLRMPSMGILLPDEVTLAETLQRAGYVTGLFGKLHFTPEGYTRDQLKSGYAIDDVGPFLEPAGVLSAATRAGTTRGSLTAASAVTASRRTAVRSSFRAPRSASSTCGPFIVASALTTIPPS